MPTNSIKGFKVGNEVLKYDYNELDNLPETNLDDLKSEIRSSVYTKSQTDTAIATYVNTLIHKITDGLEMEDYEWHQCPELVRNYLTYVSENPYSASDYSSSYISEYAPSTADQSNTKPIGKTIDGVTFTDNEPLLPTPYLTEYHAGTLTALDKLRWYNTVSINTRDLGGWDCDGGTVKYGVLVRGGQPNRNGVDTDKALMVDKIGIAAELQLYGGSDDQYSYEEGVSIWGVEWFGTDGYIWYSLSQTALWRYNLGVIFDCVKNGKPLYFHCGAGKDRTGTIAAMLLALLGVSQSDIDADYELTSFMTGTGSGITTRTTSDYKNYISAIKAFPLADGLTDSLQNRAASFVLSLGFNAAEINAFRASCIDGTPSTISPNITTYTITKSADHATFSNSISEVDENDSYEVDVYPSSGYVISNVSVTMGGTSINAFTGTETNLWRRITYALTGCSTDNNAISVIDGQGYVANITADANYTLDGATISITIGGVEMAQNYYSDGQIAIQDVTGDVVITVTAVAQAPHHTNLADPSSSEWKTGYRINSSAQIATHSNSTVTNTVPVAVGDTIRIKGVGDMSDYISASFASASETSGSRMTVSRTYDNTTDINTIVITATVYALGRFAFLNSKITTSVDDIIITRNEEIIT